MRGVAYLRGAAVAGALWRAAEGKVLDQVALLVERLRAHAAWPARDVAHLQLGDVALQPRYLCGQVQCAPHLVHPEGEVAPCEAPEALEGERLPQVTQGDVAHSVALAREGQHGVGPQPHGTVGPRCKVHPEEGVARVGHGVDVAFDQVALVRVEHQVVAAEGHDARQRRAPGGRRQPVGVQPRTHHHASREYALAVGAQYGGVVGAGAISRRLGDGGARARTRRSLGLARHVRRLHGLRRLGYGIFARIFGVEAHHLPLREHLAACGLEVVGIAPCDARPVDHARRGAAYGRDARAVRLRLAHLLGRGKQLRALDAIGPGALPQAHERKRLAVVERDDELAHLLVRDAPRVAVCVRPAVALDAEPGLEASRRVVDARVHHAAVVARLVRRQRGLLLQHGDGERRVPQLQLARGRKAHDAAANDGHVVAVQRGGRARA